LSERVSFWFPFERISYKAVKHPRNKMYKNNHVEFNKRLHDNILYTRKQQNLLQFVPRCMECRRGLAMRILSVCPSICLSVCLSIKRVDCDKMEETYVQIFIPYERTFSLFSEKKMVGGGDAFYLKFWVNRPPLERNSRFSTDIRS